MGVPCGAARNQRGDGVGNGVSVRGRRAARGAQIAWDGAGALRTARGAESAGDGAGNGAEAHGAYKPPPSAIGTSPVTSVVP